MVSEQLAACQVVALSSFAGVIKQVYCAHKVAKSQSSCKLPQQSVNVTRHCNIKEALLLSSTLRLRLINMLSKEIHASKVPFSTRVISNMVDIIQENSNTTIHTLYFGNLFNKYELLVKLSGLKIRAIGTIRPYRSNGADAVILPRRAPSTYGPELSAVRTNSDTKSGIRTTGALPKNATFDYTRSEESNALKFTIVRNKINHKSKYSKHKVMIVEKSKKRSATTKKNEKRHENACFMKHISI
ncbi:Restriction of telomere capping protein [Trichinella spiralis]|uniref:Restriction of telomere capping protein n=1 Tax=Trichinella spiralis TaxID=6334 RepID=A0ABR3L0B7_TRISP